MSEEMTITEQVEIRKQQELEANRARAASWEMDGPVSELFNALSTAQQEIGTAVKDHKADIVSAKGKYSYNFATLAGVQEACMGPLTKNGLCITQIPLVHGNFVGCMTILGHASGAWIRSALLLPRPDQGAPIHAIGSAITYARRYSLSAVAGVATEDDDGGAAVKASSRSTAGKAPETKPAPRTTRGSAKKPEPTKVKDLDPSAPPPHEDPAPPAEPPPAASAPPVEPPKPAPPVPNNPPPVPTCADDVVAVNGSQKGQKLADWPTDYLLKSIRILETRQKHQNGLEVHLAKTLELAKIEAGRRIEADADKMKAEQDAEAGLNG